MPTVLNPRWLHAITVLPLLTLLTLGYLQYSILEPLLDPAGLALWKLNGTVLSVLIVLFFTAAVVLDALRNSTGWFTLSLLFAAVSVYLVWSYHSEPILLPPDVPGWFGSRYVMSYLLALTMPSLVWSVFCAVRLSTHDPDDGSPANNFLSALAVPIGVYLAGMLLLPLINPRSSVGFVTLVMVPLVLGIALFLYLLLRGTYLLALRRAENSTSVHQTGLILITLVLPLTGLVANQLLYGGGWSGDSGIFGSFHHPLVYALAISNGLYCSLPRGSRYVAYRLLLFVAGSAGLSFLLYFVLVFLPFIPLAVVAVLAFGLGILMLAPVLMLPVQLHRLGTDFRFLSRMIDGRVLIFAGVIAGLALPVFLTVDYLQDRHALDRAMAYVYHPAELTGEVSDKSLRRVLRHVRASKDDNGGGIRVFGGGQPYLSEYYNWLVLDNLTLSETKLRKLESVFLGTRHAERPNTVRTSSVDPVSISYARASSSWDSESGAWHSWVHLELLADTSLFGQGEYTTTLDLPEGAFVDDYYLYVGDRREAGVLAERRSATWVYNQVVERRRDPGLLRYVSANRVRLNVFPFVGGENRRTGFRILHREPLTLTIDDRTLPLGRRDAHPLTRPVIMHGVTYLSREFKRALPRTELSPRIHYVLDASRRYLELEDFWTDRLTASAATLPPAFGAPPTVTLAGTYPTEFDYATDWESRLDSVAPGGFFAERAIEDILNGWLAAPDSTYPVIVIVGDDPVIGHDFSAYATALPAGLHLYQLTTEGQLEVWGSNGEPISLPGVRPAHRYKAPDGGEVYLPADDAPALLIDRALADEAPIGRTPASWRRAVQLRGRYLANRRAGRTEHAAWLREVRGSFGTGVLMPTTSLIVLENEAQQRALLRRQKEVLDADPHFDLEETLEMSEPGPWLYLILLPLLLYLAPALRRP